MASSSSSSSSSPLPFHASFTEENRHLFDYQAAVCRIVRTEDGQGLGTGFLVAESVVMTCRHVIPDPAAAEKCHAQFFNPTITHESPGYKEKAYSIIEVQFEKDRFFSSEQNRNSEGNLLSATEGKLDYSIVFLKKNPYEGRAIFFSLFERRVSPFQQQAKAFVFQYPDVITRTASGDLMCGEFKLATGDIQKRGVFETHYTTDTAPGSSGGPVTDSDGNLIALHYQENITDCDCLKEHRESRIELEELSEDIRKDKKLSAIRGQIDSITRTLEAKEPSCNAGVRIDKIIEDLERSGEPGKLSKRQQIEVFIDESRHWAQRILTARLIAFHRQEQTASVLGIQGNWLFPIEGVYTDLAIIGNDERNENKKKKETFEDRRIPTHETLYQPKIPIRLQKLFNSCYAAAFVAAKYERKNQIDQTIDSFSLRSSKYAI